MSAEKNPSAGEFSEDVDLQEAYNKLCKVVAKDVMNVELGLKKIATLELEKKNLLVKLFDANDLLNNVKSENMLLLQKGVKWERGVREGSRRWHIKRKGSRVCVN